jgi:5'-nucleotidase
LYKKSIVIERSGRKIGLVGALLAATVNMTNTENLHILNEIESVKKESERLKNEEDVDIIIVLSHCGLVIDRRMALQGGSAIDVIVGGHSHTFLYSGIPLPSTNVPADEYPIVYEQPGGHKVLIVQAFAYTKYLGDLTVYFDANGEIRKWEGNPIFLENSIVPDPEIIEAMKPWKAVVDQVANRKIGVVKTTLNQRDCNSKQCNIGNFITDAFVDYYVEHPDYKNDEGSWTYGTIAITNHGGIRTGLPSGEIKFDEIFMMLPYQNTIDSFELQGLHILETLEYSASAYKNFNFLQFSGLRVVYNVTEPVNHRVVSVDVLCRHCDVPRYQKLEVNRWYRVFVPSYIGDGGNDFTAMSKNRRNYRKGGKTDSEIVERYLKKLSPVIYKNEGRIKVLT